MIIVSSWSIHMLSLLFPLTCTFLFTFLFIPSMNNYSVNELNMLFKMGLFITVDLFVGA